MSNLIDTLTNDLRHANAARFLNNHELADALMRGLWCQLKVGSPEIALLEETIERLRANLEKPE